MCFSEGIAVPGRQVRGHCELLRGVRLHGGALPHRHQEPRPGHLLPSGQAGGHHRPAARPAQGDDDDDDDDDDDGDDDQVYWLPAPVFIMGVVAAVAGGLAVLFPETLGETLPETAEEAARWGMRHHCTVKHHTDIINFACMTWNFVRISASLSALCTNFYQIWHWHCISCKILPHFDVRTISVVQKL